MIIKSLIFELDVNSSDDVCFKDYHNFMVKYIEAYTHYDFEVVHTCTNCGTHDIIIVDNPLGILGIQGLSIRESNRNSIILNTSIALNKDKPRNVELLNYQSNILYLIINGLSPSLY